jgi:hypothetical protein
MTGPRAPTGGQRSGGGSRGGWKGQRWPGGLAKGGSDRELEGETQVTPVSHYVAHLYDHRMYDIE